MNVYDFDKTVFYPDSSDLFCRWFFRRHPGAFAKICPAVIVNYVRYKLGKYELKRLKEQAFSFLNDVDDIDAEVKTFWSIYRGNLLPWYLKQKREDDIIISASPEFLLEPICEELRVELIGTKMDKHTGLIEGENNKWGVKVDRFYANHPDGQIDEFYSDSLTDTPLAKIAKRAFMVVNKDKLIPWPDK